MKEETSPETLQEGTMLYTYEDMMNVAGWMAAVDYKRPIAELKEEAEVYIGKITPQSKQPQQGVRWVHASERQPINNIPVFAKNVKGRKLTAFYVKSNSYEMEFDDMDDTPDFVDDNNGKLTLKEGWYEECENNGYYDLMIYKREISEWLDETPTPEPKEQIK